MTDPSLILVTQHTPPPISTTRLGSSVSWPTETRFIVSSGTYHTSGRTTVSVFTNPVPHTCIPAPFPTSTTLLLTGTRFEMRLRSPVMWLVAADAMNQAAFPAFTELLLPAPVELPQGLDPQIRSGCNVLKLSTGLHLHARLIQIN
uniref:Uncharacterized protein n=1 Tax=Arundo donax TaxID=35708 RepID=A0A0A9BJE2_ARUDO